MATTLASTTRPIVLASSLSPAPTQPPIAHVISILSLTTSSVLSVLRALFTAVFTPIYHLLYRPLSYILAPFVLFLYIVFDVFVRTPLAIIQYLAEQVYPIYLLVGVACICGALVGLASRGVAAGIVSVILGALPVGSKVRTKSEVGIKKEGMAVEPKPRGRRGNLRRPVS